MGHQIIRQPNGKFAIWSTIVDNFILLDAMLDEIVDYEAKQARARIASDVYEIYEEMSKGERPYHQFTMSWEKAVSTVKKLHGAKDDTYKWIKKNIEQKKL